MALYRQRLSHHLPDAFSKLLHLPDTQECDPKDDEIPTFESSPAALEQRLERRGFSVPLFFGNDFETTSALTRFHPASISHV